MTLGTGWAPALYDTTYCQVTIVLDGDSRDLHCRLPVLHAEDCQFVQELTIELSESIVFAIRGTDRENYIFDDHLVARLVAHTHRHAERGIDAAVIAGIEVGKLVALREFNSALTFFGYDERKCIGPRWVGFARTKSRIQSLLGERLGKAWGRIEDEARVRSSNSA